MLFIERSPLVDPEVEIDPEDDPLIPPAITAEELVAEVEGDETLKSLLDDMLNLCARYTGTVCRFKQIVQASVGPDFDQDERKEIETLRTSSHDATIASIDIFTRSMVRAGKKCPWAKGFSSPGGKDRTKYGKFAILITFARLRTMAAAATHQTYE